MNAAKKKDFAVLFNIQAFLTSTAGMAGDACGWYLRLLLHNYDKGDLPSDTEELAVLAGVRRSEYSRFEQVLEQVLSKKFVINSRTNRLENPKAAEVLNARENFVEKRTRAGHIGVITKRAKEVKGYHKHKKQFTDYLNSLDDSELEILKEVDRIAEVIESFNTEPKPDTQPLSFVEPEYMEAFSKWLEHKKGRGEKYKTADSLLTAYTNLKKFSGGDSLMAKEIIDTAVGANWAGFFPLKNQPKPQSAAPKAGKAQSLHNQSERLKMQFENDTE